MGAQSLNDLVVDATLNITNQTNQPYIHTYSETPLVVRPPLLHQKSGLSRGVASRQGYKSIH